jgi:exodeoxyribonuclease VII large subunit
MSAFNPDAAVFTVSRLNERARQLLEISFANVRVEGEISGLSRPSSGHWYFTLKDSGAQVRCAMFRSRTALLKFQPQNGDQVEIRARVSLYEARGDYQLIVDSMKPGGEGALLLAFEQLKQRLAAEGLFVSEHKRALPRVRRAGVITSTSGAALHDILTVLGRRSPDIEVDIYPTLVQGREAAGQIVAAIQRANRDQRVDVLIVGRGGGSLEDLWCFNEEVVARAIFNSAIPVVSAVGHEVDFTIADFVADLRAPTPSAAAELISQDQQQRRQHLQQLQQRLLLAQRTHSNRYQQRLRQVQAELHNPLRRIQNLAQQVDHSEQRLQAHMQRRLREQQWRLQRLTQSLAHQHPRRILETVALQNRQLQQRLQRAMQQRLRLSGQQLAQQAQLLQSVSPLQVLARGYSLCQSEQGELIRDYQQVEPRQTITTRLQNGWISSRVISRGADMQPSENATPLAHNETPST